MEGLMKDFVDALDAVQNIARALGAYVTIGVHVENEGEALPERFGDLKETHRWTTEQAQMMKISCCTAYRLKERAHGQPAIEITVQRHMREPDAAERERMRIANRIAAEKYEEGKTC